MRIALFVSAVASLLFIVSPSRAAETADVQSLLAHPIIGPQVALAEVQDYTEARVPRMPDMQDPIVWHRLQAKLREDVLSKVVYRGEAIAWRDAQTRVEWLDTIAGGPGYRIRKLRYEALPGLWIPALLYMPEKLSGRVPAMLAVNGHDGQGKAAKYKQLRCINLAKRGMLALNVEWLGMGQLREPGFMHYKMNQLDLCGTPGLAPFYLAMKRGLDIVLSLEHADASRVAVSGLSGGGWQTIIISALDTRVQLANPVAGYSSFLTRVRNLSDLGDSEQTPVDLATVADYSHLTAMMAPRGLLLTYNVKDNCCFASGHALPPLLEAAAPAFKLYEVENKLASHVNHDPGTHNFEQDNREALYRVIGQQFYEDSADFNAEEIPSDDEVKSAEELNVPLPKDNHNFNTLAVKLIEKLPRDAALPTDKAAATAWQQRRRAALKEVVKAKDYQVAAQAAGTETKGDITAKLWRLRIGDAWTVPAVELTRTRDSASKGTTLLVADGGRTSIAAEAEKLLAAGQRVVAVDPFYFGESKIAQKDMLFGLLVSAVGDRPLGLQASQVAAVARWLADEKGRNLGPVSAVAVGPRSSLFTLVAAGLEERAIASLELRQSYGSLKEIIEQNQSVDKAPELFTFGLLEQFDIRQLIALTAPRPVTLLEASDRAKSESKYLHAWYTLLGGKPGPVE